MKSLEEKTARVRITGRVQGVGFRFWTHDEANRRGLAGWVRNNPDGSVEALFNGPTDDVEAMLRDCWRGPNFSHVGDVELLPEQPGDEDAPLPFIIRR